MGTFLTIIVWVILIVALIFSVFINYVTICLFGGTMLCLEEQYDVELESFDSAYWSKRFYEKQKKKP